MYVISNGTLEKRIASFTGLIEKYEAENEGTKVDLKHEKIGIFGFTTIELSLESQFLNAKRAAMGNKELMLMEVLKMWVKKDSEKATKSDKLATFMMKAKLMDMEKKIEEKRSEVAKETGENVVRQ